MKKIISVALVLCLLFSMGITASAAPRTEKVDITYRAISIVLDGKEITPCDAEGNTVEPFIMNGTTYLPLRAIAQAMGLGVAWDGKTNTVTLTSGGEVITGAGAPGTTKETKSVTITYRDIKVILDGVQLELVNAAGDTVEPFILDGTTYLPLRIVGEALDLGVSWDSATSTVGVKQPEVKPEEPGKGEWYNTKVTFTSENPDLLPSYTETSYHPDGSIKTEFTKDAYAEYFTEYDTKGNLTHQYNKDDFSYTEIFVVYDAQDREIENTLIDHTNSYRDHSVITYGSNGRPASIRCDFSGVDNGEAYSGVYTDIYVWNGDTATISTVYDGDDTVYEAGTYTLVYDAYGNIVKNHRDTGEYYSGNEYTYDANGNMTYFRAYNSDGYWEETRSTYDADGNLLSFSYTSPSFSHSFEHKYNDRGDEIYGRYVDYDGSVSETWTSYFEDGRVSGMRFKNSSETMESTYNYDENNVLVSVIDVFMYPDGSFLTAVSEYSYDANGNISRITTDEGGVKTYRDYEWTFIAG